MKSAGRKCYSEKTALIDCRWWVIAGMLVLLLAPIASAQSMPRTREPVTLHVTLEAGDQLAPEYPIATLGTAPDDSAVLGLVWAPVPVGWFGSVWGLHLVSSEGVLPTNLATSGTGTLAGLNFYTLVNADPVANHTYQAMLSYDPSLGSVSVRVEDVTAGRTLVERGLALLPYDGSYVPTQTETDTNRLVRVESGFTPAGLTWRLVHVEPNGTMPPANPVDRTRPVDLYVQMPWKELPGSLRLRLDDEVIGTFHDVTSGALFQTVLDEYPAGSYQVALEYVDQGTSVVLGETDVSIGVVSAWLEGVTATVTGSREVTISGQLVVRADAEVPDITVGLDAVLNRVGLSAEASGTTYRFTSEADARQSLPTHPIPTLTETEVYLPFTATMEVSSVEWPYRLWEVKLVPVVESPAAARLMEYTGQVRIYAEQEPGPGQTLRVMSYNIHHGEGMDGTLDLQRIADAIAYSGADIVGLQEVDVRTRRSGGVDQLAVLAELLRMEWAFGSNLLYQGGNYGNGLLSRYPMMQTENTRLPNIGGESRGLLSATVDVDGRPVTVYVTHLSLNDEENQLQRRRIAEILEREEHPFVVLGDMNVPWDFTQSPLFADAAQDAWLEAVDLSAPDSPMRRNITMGSTFSSSSPTQRIDYIFVSDEVDVTGSGSVFTIRTLASDHLPLVAELELKD